MLHALLWWPTLSTKEVHFWVVAAKQCLHFGAFRKKSYAQYAFEYDTYENFQLNQSAFCKITQRLIIVVFWFCSKCMDKFSTDTHVRYHEDVLFHISIYLCLWIEYSRKISYPLSLSKVGNLPRISTMQLYIMISRVHFLCFLLQRHMRGPPLDWHLHQCELCLLSRAVCEQTIAGC